VTVANAHQVKAIPGRKTEMAIVATARKLLGIIWHLLITGEEYIDKHYVKKKQQKSILENNNLRVSSGSPRNRFKTHYHLHLDLI